LAFINEDLVPAVILWRWGELKAVHRIKDFFSFVIDELNAGTKPKDLVGTFADSSFSFLRGPPAKDAKTKKRFTPGVKSKRVITEELAVAKRCSVCKARVPNLGLSFDHKTAQEDGGIGDIDNSDFTHHYCNSAKKRLTSLFPKVA
jgi:hypothetical protein